MGVRRLCGMLIGLMGLWIGLAGGGVYLRSIEKILASCLATLFESTVPTHYDFAQVSIPIIFSLNWTFRNN